MNKHFVRFNCLMWGFTTGVNTMAFKSYHYKENLIGAICGLVAATLTIVLADKGE